MNEMTTVEDDIDAQKIEAAQRLADALITATERDGNEYVVKNVTNAVAMLTHHPAWDGVLAFDAFNGRSILTGPIPGSREDNVQPFPGRIVKDTDHTATRMWFDRHLPGLPKEMIIDAFDQAVHNNVADPLRQYIEDAMAAWDGKARIERLFDDYFVSEFEDAYSRELGRIAMMTLVQRTLYPGAFQKMVPILEGKQDIGKSSALRALCPKPEWFLDNIPRDLNSADTSIALKGTFLLEIAELAAINRTSIPMEEVKKFITRQVEDYRPKYGKHNVQEPRRFMTWGTTNSQNYLRDETGSARFFPIRLTKVDVEAITRDRDQLLGEAGVLLTRGVDAGERWWEFSKEAQAILDQTREEKSDDHQWISIVLNFVEGRDEVSIREILTTGTCAGGLGIDDRSTKRGESNAVAGILHGAGWMRDGLITLGKYKAAARYVPGS